MLIREMEISLEVSDHPTKGRQRRRDLSFPHPLECVSELAQGTWVGLEGPCVSQPDLFGHLATTQNAQPEHTLQVCACPRGSHEAGLATECPASNQLHGGRPTLGVLEGPWGHRAPDETPPPGCGWNLPLLKSFVLTVSVAPGPGRPPCGPWCRPEGPSSFTGMILQQTADVVGVAT